MSDENVTANETTEETLEITEALPQGDAKEIDWKAQARKWEQRAKDAQADKALADKWREYEQNQKSDNEKLAEQLASTQAAAADATAKLLRYEVATEKGVPSTALDLLVGSSREELEAAAEKLLSLIADQTKPKTPKPDDNQGKPATAAIGQLTKEDLKTMTPAQIMEAKLAGRLNDILGIH
jgi:hypothetical protein